VAANGGAVCTHPVPGADRLRRAGPTTGPLLTTRSTTRPVEKEHVMANETPVEAPRRCGTCQGSGEDPNTTLVITGEARPQRLRCGTCSGSGRE
jgi:DnaJ-class molecular chaperone